MTVVNAVFIIQVILLSQVEYFANVTQNIQRMCMHALCNCCLVLTYIRSTLS